MFRRTKRSTSTRSASLSLLSLSTILLLASGCGASVHSGTSSPVTLDYRAAFAPAGQSATLSIRSDRARYTSGEAITLSLHNGSTVVYGADANCATPTAVWLRGSDGATYFANSGAYSSCDEKGESVAPGAQVNLTTIDSELVWVDQSRGEKLFRLPSALPAGHYTVHALTARGEITTSLEIAAR